MALFNLKKTRKPTECHAMRCTNSQHWQDEGGTAIEHPVDLWGVNKVYLCEYHTKLADDFHTANPDFKPEKRALSEGEALEAVATDTAREAAEGKDILDIIDGLDVQTQEGLEFANALLRDVKAKLKKLEADEKSITQPQTTALQRVRALFRPAKTAWADVELRLKRKLITARLLEDSNNKKALAEAMDAHDRGDAEGHAAALERVHSATDLEGTSIITKWSFEIEDESLLPREFLMPNMTLIHEHCSHSTQREPTPIPGVRFYPDGQVRTRASAAE